MAKKKRRVTKTKGSRKVDIDKLLAESGYGEKKWGKNIAIGLAIAAAVVVIALLIYQYGTGEYAGKAYFAGEEGTFIESANKCEPAVMEKKIGTTTLRLEIKPDCAINKKVVAMDETEPLEIRDLFIGKDMDCTYDKGNFPTDYVTQISGDLGYCTGPLVSAILAVI